MLNKKTIILIIIISITAASAVILVYADRNAEELIGRDDSKGKFEEQKQETKRRPADKISTTTVAKNTDVSADEIDVSDWQIYKNEGLGIEFKYPGGWMLKNSSYDQYIKISIMDPQETDLIFWVQLPIPEIGYEKWTKTNEEKIIVNNLNATKVFLEGNQEINNNFILTYWNMADYADSGQITFSYPKGSAMKRYELIFNQFIDNFKFIN